MNEFIRGEGKAFINTGNGWQELNNSSITMLTIPNAAIQVPNADFFNTKTEWSGSFTMKINEDNRAFFDHIYDWAMDVRKWERMQTLRRIAYEKMLMNSLWPENN
jgi:hypothetical protein